MRAAAAAFNDMQARIARFEAERLRTLAAVGHDLRTPITSLRIRAEMLDEDEGVPMIRTLDDARLVVECTKYPPLGLRGLHTTSPHTSFSRPADVKQYAQECNDSLLTILQVETAEALAIVDDLAAVDGVDCFSTPAPSPSGSPP